MEKTEHVRIALIGAAGMSFGPIMVYDALRAEKIRGATLVLMDINEKALDVCYRAACRLNRAMGSPIQLEMTTDIARALDGTQFVLFSVEKNRFKYWKQDYEIPRKHGSPQIMGENGGPGGLFHSLRSINLVLSICRDVEKYSPDAFVINLTNPMSRVMLAIARLTSLRSVGLCHEHYGGTLRIATHLLIPMERIQADASGINHFTWFYNIEDKKTGEDLYPRLRRHVRRFPFLHPPLVRHTLKEYGLFPTSTDSHIGEYLPYAHKVNRFRFPYHSFFHGEWHLRNTLTAAYARGWLYLPARHLPKSGELAFPIIEALATGERTYLEDLNVPNRGYIPNLPDGAIVEVPADTGDDIEPRTVPPLYEPLAELARAQLEIQTRIVDAVEKKDPDIAFEALLMDPLTPGESAARKIFDEMFSLQRDCLPF